MQEHPAVGWDPIAINHHLPWESRLFLLYLLVVGAISLVKSVSLVRQLWSANPEVQSSRWEACSAKVQSIKRLVVLTFLLSVLLAADRTATVLIQLGSQKFFAVWAFSGEIAEVLKVFALGMLGCAMLYVVSGLFEGVLLRRRASWKDPLARIKKQSPQA
ncbi:MAG: hypothetical protein ACHP7P_04335 [Terriglobales bacterium]